MTPTDKSKRSKSFKTPKMDTRQNEASVTLHTGEQVSNYSEEWRSECEARTRLKSPIEQRKDMLDIVEKRRGAEGRLKLEADMLALEPAHVLDMPNRDVRRAYLGKVEYLRGALARERLEEAILALHEKRKSETLAAA